MNSTGHLKQIVYSYVSAVCGMHVLFHVTKVLKMWSYYIILWGILECVGLTTFISRDESCDPSNNFTMCPMCIRRCPYWNYAATCTDVRASHMFDNPATVVFAAFMSLWGNWYI